MLLLPPTAPAGGGACLLIHVGKGEYEVCSRQNVEFGFVVLHYASLDQLRCDFWSERKCMGVLPLQKSFYAVLSRLSFHRWTYEPLTMQLWCIGVVGSGITIFMSCFLTLALPQGVQVWREDDNLASILVYSGLHILVYSGLYNGLHKGLHPSGEVLVKG